MEKVEWDDVQAIVLRGYGKLPYSAYLLWHFNTGSSLAKKQWLAALTERLMRASAGDDEDEPDASPAAQERALGRNSSPPAINLALTASGLQRLGVGESALNGFSTEFLEGMAPLPSDKTTVPRRSNVLGDIGQSSPQCWDWGGWQKEREIDGLLLLFAADEPSLRELVEREMRIMAGVARPIPLDLRGHFNDGFKEHFGFKDGISQPLIEGAPRRKKSKHLDEKQARISLVKPGEFLLGYLNERRERLGNRRGTNGDGPKTKRDLRLNGTYLVFRQLQQDVAAFDAFISTLAECLCETKDWVAARLMGRKPDGTSLIQDRIDAPKNGVRNDFLYHFEDRFGLACPVGAHVRRANPRDSLGPDPDTALDLSKMHRIIRRGRPYGNKWEPSGRTEDTDEHRGMLFIALNADIAGQFEMIQHTWLNNPHFGGLCTGTDPISHFDDGGLITIQRRPTNLQIKRAAPFVRVRGGAYFFLPGIQALRDIAASLSDEPHQAASNHLSPMMS